MKLKGVSVCGLCPHHMCWEDSKKRFVILNGVKNYSLERSEKSDANALRYLVNVRPIRYATHDMLLRVGCHGEPVEPWRVGLPHHPSTGSG